MTIAAPILGLEAGRTRALDGTCADVGRAIRGFFAGGSILAGSVVVEALCLLWLVASDVLDAFEIESRILWNFLFVVLKAVGILDSKKQQSNQQ